MKSERNGCLAGTRGKSLLEPVQNLLRVGQTALKMAWVASPAWAALS